MLNTTGEVKTNSVVKFYYELLHMDTPVLADQQSLIYISTLQIFDAVKKTFQEQWSIGILISNLHSSQNDYISKKVKKFFLKLRWKECKEEDK